MGVQLGRGKGQENEPHWVIVTHYAVDNIFLVMQGLLIFIKY